MTKQRKWLRHPAREIRQTRNCPSGLTWFANIHFAYGSLIHGNSDHHLIAVECEQCGGAHVISDKDPS